VGQEVNSKEMHKECTRMRDLLVVQKQIIERHIDEHKWFQHIPDKNEATSDFLEKFGWIMRELICGYICAERFNCKIAQKYLPPNPDPT